MSGIGLWPVRSIAFAPLGIPVEEHVLEKYKERAI